VFFGLAKVQYRGGVPCPTVIRRGIVWAGAPIIAIVDDDASIRRALHRLVQAKGYTVASFRP
jgi:hypothetical protein